MIRLVIFDFSGVLINDLRESWLSISKIMRLNEKKPDTLDEFRKNFRLPYWDYLVAKGFTLAEAKDPKIVQDYKQFYGELADYVKVFDDVVDTLAVLAKKRMQLAVASHSPRGVVNMMMSRFGLQKFFKEEDVYSLEDYKEQKPHPESILRVLDNLDYHANHAIYVGDMREDIEAARRAGVRSVAIHRENGSYHTEQLLRREGPTFFVSRLTQVLDVVREGET